MTLSVLPVFVSGTFTSHTSSSSKQIHPEFFSLKKDNRIRRHEATLAKYQCRLDIRKYSRAHYTQMKKLVLTEDNK